MDIKYKLKKDIVSRTASMLAWNINEIAKDSNIRIIYNGNVFNAKSLIGILHNHIMCGEEIKITIEDLSIVEDIKEIFNVIAEEI